jgi:quercetin dioxygenase-like cupin family protein
MPTRYVMTAAFTFAAVAVVLAPGTTSAAETTAEAAPEPMVTQPLTKRHAFSDAVAARITVRREGLDDVVVDLDDASNMTVVEFTVQPGFKFPWHSHPALALVAVTEGELVYVDAGDCIQSAYPAGTAFVDPGFGHVHMAFNPSEDDEASVVVTFLGAPEEGSLTLPVAEEEGAALDETCEIVR